MKVVVIGGAGYVGRPLVQQLRLHADVVSVGHRPGAGVDTQVDLRDGEGVTRLLGREKPDVVVVTAYMLDRASNADPLRAVETNVLGMTHVFQAAADLGAARVVFTSSGAVHGDGQRFERPLDEAEPCQPTTLYGQMKLFNEWMAAHYNANFGTEIVSYRISGPYGWGKPHDRQGGEMPFDFVVDAARVNTQAVLPWSASTRFRFIHVADAAASCVPLVLASSLQHRVYNSPGFTVSVRELADAARSLSGLECAFTEPGRPVKLVWWDATRYEEEFDFRPRPMAEWMRAELQGDGDDLYSPKP
jgi:UDP-glucose 4-epimerase